MQNTLVNNSNIWVRKSKFFIYRLVTYFSFLLVPIWIQKTNNLNQFGLSVLMVFYLLFMVGQWFLLGKEIDHRLKIYFRVNSSMDRVVYRLFLGMTMMVVYFNLLSFLPSKWTENIFWATWVITGLFYSWPTRGKIIQESMTSHFNEFHYLDAFERTLFTLIISMFILSYPELPNLQSIGGLKLFFDPMEKIGAPMWNFIQVNYIPFKRYPELSKIAWCAHFYFVGMGFFLTCLYAFLRYFVSRRLSLLGVFALLSSWAYSKILSQTFGASLSTTYSLLWVWSLFWAAKSSTYRGGLFIGLVGFLGAIINWSFIFLLPLQLGLLYFYLLKDKTVWYRRQFIRYASFGSFLSLIVLFSGYEKGVLDTPLRFDYLSNVFYVFERKAFFVLSVFGLLVLALNMMFPKLKAVQYVDSENPRKFNEVLILFMALIAYSVVFDVHLVKDFSLMWFFTVFSLLPVELIFRTMTRLRSRRNMIYLIYILICLLDSHFEGRVKIFSRLF